MVSLLCTQRVRNLRRIPALLLVLAICQVFGFGQIPRSSDSNLGGAAHAVIRLKLNPAAAAMPQMPLVRRPVRVSRSILSFVSPHAPDTTWAGGAGNWSNASLWSGGVPNSTTNAFIDGGKAIASPVNLDISGSVNNLTISSGDSLGIGNNLSLTVNGTALSDAGNLTLNSLGNGTSLLIGGANVLLSGGGTVTLSANTQNFIYGTVGSNVLTN